MILESVENGPLIWLTVKENRVTRTKKYVELSTAEKIQADCDMKATNIILQGLSVSVFSPGDDPIACLNKAMFFLTVVASSRVKVQQVQGRQGQCLFGTGYKSNATSSGGNNASGHARVVKCYNCQDYSLVSGLRMFKTHNRELLLAHELFAAAPRVVDLVDSPMSTSIDQDTPSTKQKNFKQAMTKPSWIDEMNEKHVSGNAKTSDTGRGRVKVATCAKLDLELVPKEKRLEIGKCNERLNPRKIQREPTFQVVLDALALTPCYSAFLITADVPKVYMHQFWDSVYKHENFYRFKMDKRKRFKLNLEIFKDIFKICPRVQGQDFDALPTDEEIVYFPRELGHTGEINSLNDTIGLDKLPLFRAQILWENKIGMHTSRDDYLINTLRFVFAKEETQIYGAILLEYLTSPDMKETQPYKTYLGFAIGATPPKKVQKFKKLASPKLTTVPVSTEEPTGNSKRVKRHAKKSTEALARGGCYSRKSMRDLYKIRHSRSSTITKTTSSVAKIKPFVTSKGTGVKPGDPDVSKEESFESEAESLRNDEDDSNNEQDSSGEDSDQENDSDDDKTQSGNENKSNSKHETDESESGLESNHEENKEDEDDEKEVKDEFVKTMSNDFNDKDETKITDKAQGDEDEEMYYTTSQLYDDVDIRLNEPVDADKGFVQEECTNATLTNIQQGNENPKILPVIEDDHVTLSIILQKTAVLVTSSFHSSDLAAKFLNFSDIPHIDT
uniref:Retrovirus-related Pol polyprotein from transposon TNT 1-94 n=1 Tax=Tanacetum cinerariifolium TaxID=118510 RepID=A0A6L2KL87_TANCI|nr:hypothetical protein [Tanacetum cinerariifolium]